MLITFSSYVHGDYLDFNITTVVTTASRTHATQITIVSGISKTHLWLSQGRYLFGWSRTLKCYVFRPLCIPR